MKYISVQAVLDYVDELKCNNFSRSTKLIWLNEIEYRVQTDVMLFAAESVGSVPDDDSHELLVPAPFYEIYYDYLFMKISEHTEESSEQNNRAATFDKAFTRFMRWWADTYHPADGKATFKGYYVMGPQGPAGSTPRRGIEYWTPADVADIERYVESINAHYEGDYSADTEYGLNAVVKFNDNLYWHKTKTPTTGVDPSDGEVWEIALKPSAVSIDPTLSESGFAADAKAVGDWVAKDLLMATGDYNVPLEDGTTEQMPANGSSGFSVPGEAKYINTKNDATVKVVHGYDADNNIVVINTQHKTHLVLPRGYRFFRAQLCLNTNQKTGTFDKQMLTGDLSEYVEIGVPCTINGSVAKAEKVMNNARKINAIEWVCKREGISVNGEGGYIFKKGVKYNGMPYVRATYLMPRYLGYTVSPHTFVNAANDEDSMFYVDEINVEGIGNTLSGTLSVSASDDGSKRLVFAGKVEKGTYIFTVHATSNDTDSTMCKISFRNADATYMEEIYVPRNKTVFCAVSFSEPVDHVAFFSATTIAEGSGDTATFSNMSLKKYGFGYGTVCTTLCGLASGFRLPFANVTYRYNPDIIIGATNQPPLGSVYQNYSRGHVVIPTQHINGKGWSGVVIAESTGPTSAEKMLISDIPTTTTGIIMREAINYLDDYGYSIVSSDTDIDLSAKNFFLDFNDVGIVNGSARPYKGDKSVYTSEDAKVLINIKEVDSVIPSTLFVQKRGTSSAESISINSNKIELYEIDGLNDSYTRKFVRVDVKSSLVGDGIYDCWTDLNPTKESFEYKSVGTASLTYTSATDNITFSRTDSERGNYDFFFAEIGAEKDDAEVGYAFVLPNSAGDYSAYVSSLPAHDNIYLNHYWLKGEYGAYRVPISGE